MDKKVSHEIQIKKFYKNPWEYRSARDSIYKPVNNPNSF